MAGAGKTSTQWYAAAGSGHAIYPIGGNTIDVVRHDFSSINVTLTPESYAAFMDELFHVPEETQRSGFSARVRFDGHTAKFSVRSDATEGGVASLDISAEVDLSTLPQDLTKVDREGEVLVKRRISTTLPGIDGPIVADVDVYTHPTPIETAAKTSDGRVLAIIEFDLVAKDGRTAAERAHDLRTSWTGRPEWIVADVTDTRSLDNVSMATDPQAAARTLSDIGRSLGVSTQRRL